MKSNRSAKFVRNMTADAEAEQLPAVLPPCRPPRDVGRPQPAPTSRAGPVHPTLCPRPQSEALNAPTGRTGANYSS